MSTDYEEFDKACADFLEEFGWDIKAQITKYRTRPIDNKGHAERVRQAAEMLRSKIRDGWPDPPPKDK